MLKELIPALFGRKKVSQPTLVQPPERSQRVPITIPLSAADGTISQVEVVFDPEQMPFSEEGLNKLSVLAKSQQPKIGEPTEHVDAATSEDVQPPDEELLEEFEEQPEAPQIRAPELLSEDANEIAVKAAEEIAGAGRWEDWIIFGIPPAQNSKFPDLGHSQLGSVVPQWETLPARPVSRNPLLRTIRRLPVPRPPSLSVLPENSSPLTLIPEQQKTGPLARLRLVIAPIMIALVAGSSTPDITTQSVVNEAGPPKTIFSSVDESDDASPVERRSPRYLGQPGVRPADDTPEPKKAPPPVPKSMLTDRPMSGGLTLSQVKKE